jgi:23S rRNA (adenine2503-C2)-methyltransferase
MSPVTRLNAAGRAISTPGSEDKTKCNAGLNGLHRRANVPFVQFQGLKRGVPWEGVNNSDPMQRTNLKTLSGKGLEFFFRELNLPSYRVRQLIHWIYERRASSLDEITEFPKGLRAALSETAYIGAISLLERQFSADGTEKFLFSLHDRERIESVLIPDEDRLTLCISSQAGCALSCRFCLTGRLGLRRNLMADEIAEQVLSVQGLISPRNITNIVLMGMGEPLANFDETVEALWRIVDFMKFSPRRVTVSTAGVVPKILELPRRAPAVNLAISLNAATDELRESIMPINRTYPLQSLIAVCRRYPLPRRRRITFEYVLLRGVNDSTEYASRLARILKGIPSKINLIPFNPYEGAEFERPEDERVFSFQEALRKRGFTAIVRKSRGKDISAACGQLNGGHC